MRLNTVFGGLIALFFAVMLTAPQLSADAKLSNTRINHFQIIGSHNSYKKALPEESKRLFNLNGIDANKYAYYHNSLSDQLDLGLRHLELDVVYDPQGGLFAKPLIEALSGQSLLTDTEKQELNQPGFKTLHIPDFDFASHCVLFKNCLQELKEWSVRHPDHHPIFILMNVKENNVNIEGATPPLTFDEDAYSDLDLAIASVLKEQLITPQDLIVNNLSLRNSIKSNGWPILKDTLGKFIFIFDGNEKQKEIYRTGHPSLIGRTMFASYDQNSPEAAIMIVNDPLKGATEIQNYVKSGFIVRTRSDSSYKDALNKNIGKILSAFDSGAQIISTDYYPESPQQQDGFVVSFKGPSFVRNNVIFNETFEN